MISPEYCLLMARYNRWQNEAMRKSLEVLPEAELHTDRAAFFGSIFKTVNHLLWGDMLWISRFDGGDAPSGTDLSKIDTTDMTKTLPEWAIARFQVDARFVLWAKSVSHIDLSGDLTWFSGALQREVCKPVGECIVHMFNHQTHHRGQVHAMLGAAGGSMYVSDLPFMPE